MKKRIALLCLIVAIAVPAFGFTHYLRKQWYYKGDHFCQYDNGTVLNVGFRLCPLSIEGD